MWCLIIFVWVWIWTNACIRVIAQFTTCEVHKSMRLDTQRIITHIFILKRKNKINQRFFYQLNILFRSRILRSERLSFSQCSFIGFCAIEHTHINCTRFPFIWTSWTIVIWELDDLFGFWKRVSEAGKSKKKILQFGLKSFKYSLMDCRCTILFCFCFRFCRVQFFYASSVEKQMSM